MTWPVVTEIRSKSFELVTECRHYNDCLTYVSLSYVANVIFFIAKCGITRFLCAMRAFKVRASLSPIGYLCAKIRFFHSLHYWASPLWKIQYSMNHSKKAFVSEKQLNLWIPRSSVMISNLSLWLIQVQLCKKLSSNDDLVTMVNYITQHYINPLNGRGVNWLHFAIQV